MRYLAIAAGLAFAISTVPVLGPAWAQRLNPAGTPQNVGSSALPKGMLVNDSGKCWVNSDQTNYKWGDCPQSASGKASSKEKKTSKRTASKEQPKKETTTSGTGSSGGGGGGGGRY
jgi:hypothetical protein